MAENLKKPSDFLQDEANSSFTALLIPPSEFEKPAASHLKDLEKAKKKIEELHNENEKLRLHSQASSQAVSFSSQPDFAEELIKRQAGEITELKAELMKCKQIYEEDSFKWEKRLSDTEKEHEHMITRMKEHQQRTEEELKHKLSRLSSELQRTVERSDKEVTVLKERLEHTGNSLRDRVKELEEELKKTHHEKQSAIQQLELEMRNKSKTIEDQTTQITKLKSYIGQWEEAHKPALVWKTEKETVENKWKVSEAEKQKLQSQLELMDVRFTALHDILAVQEAGLSKSKNEGLGKSRQHGLLVTRWREKVFSLLVQQKSSDIVYKNDLNDLKVKLSGLEEELASSKAKEEMLQLSLRDKSAELQMEVNNKERLQQELEQTQQVAVVLDDQVRENNASTNCLVQFVESLQKKQMETVQALEKKSQVLKALCQRVNFASSRMDLLKTQLIRRTAFSGTVHDDSKKSLSVSRADEDISRDSEDHLYQELERVMRERDSLVTQVREDSTKWGNKLAQTRTQYTSEIDTLKRTVEDLETDIQQKSKTCAKLTEEVQTLTESLRDKDSTIAQLQAELAKHAKGIESVLLEERLTLEETQSKKLSELEQKLNESKREHAKTVVSLRQMQRNHNREIERAEQLLRTTEDHLNSHVQQLQVQLQAVDRERNIMMATLRHEGLITKLRSERGEPFHLQLDEEGMDKEEEEEEGQKSVENERTYEEFTDKESNTRNKDLLSARREPEPVENVLEDLKSLTAAIFDDTHISSDENES